MLKNSIIETFWTFHWKSLIHWNTGVMFSRVSLISWGEVGSLALLGHPFTDGITIKIPYRVDVILHQQLHTPSFLIGLVKTKSDFIVRSVETGLGRWTLVVVMISVDAYPLLAFSYLTCHLEDTGIGAFWLHWSMWQ